MSSVVPEGWKLSPLGDIASVNWGNTSLTKNNYTEIGFPAFSAAGNDGLVSNAEHISTGVVLSAIGARCGRTFLTPQKWTAIKNTITILTDDQDIRFLYQVFNFDEVWNKSGGAQPFISLGDARKTLILHPPLPEQKKIASILTSVDEVIENTQKQIDKLQDLKKATMNELLTKGIGHTEFKDSELGRIPKSWEVVQLEELLSDLTYGLTVRPKYQSFGVPLVSGKECKNGWIDFSIANLISEDDFVGLRQRSLPKVGDVLFTKTGTLGRIAVVKAEYPKFAISQNVALLTPDFNVVVPKFLAYLCESESIKQQTILGASTLSVQDLQLGIMRKFRVPKVPIDEQYNIIKVIDALGLRLDRVEKKLSQTQSFKKSLMQDLLTGKVRVTVN